MTALTHDSLRRTAPVQSRFGLLAEVSPNPAVCNLGFVATLRGALDLRALARSFDALVQRHESLRTGLHREGISWRAAVLASASTSVFEVVDVRSEADVESAAKTAVRKASVAPFSMDAPPLLRAVLVRIEDEHAQLVVCCHHTVGDGVSMHRVLTDELSVLYASFRAGREPAMDPLLGSYQDFALRSEQIETSAVDEAALAFWSEQLQEIPSGLELPVDRLYPPKRAYEGATVRTVFDADLVERLREAAAAAEVKPFHFLLSTWFVFLARLSGQDTVSVGVPVGNRLESGDQTLFGCLMSTLVMPMRCEQGTDFATFAQTLRRSFREVFQHGGVPHETLVEHCAPHARGGARNALYQAMFNFMPFSADTLVLEGLDVSARRLDNGSTFVDLSVDFYALREGYEVVLDFNPEVFEHATGADLLAQFEVLVRDAVEHPRHTLRRLDRLGAQGRARVLALSRGPTVPYPRARSVVEMVESWVAAYGERDAVLFDGRTLSYAELGTRARQMAQLLAEQGAGPGTFVAVRCQDPLRYLISILGIIYAGAAYVPVDSSSPQARLREVLAGSGACALVSDASADVEAVASWVDGVVGVLAPDLATLSDYEARTPATDVDPESPVYVIYTSGSTGKPKGVAIRHRNLTEQLFNLVHAHDEPPGTLALLYSFAFDSSLASVAWTLHEGGCLLLLDPDERRDPRAIRARIAKHRVTHIDAVPSLYRALISADVSQLDTLRVVISGGEELPPAVVRRHWKVLPRTRLYNEYGPTENTVITTAYEVPRGVTEDRIPIGPPIANNRCYVLDAQQQLVPVGHPGELYIGGVGVSAGYLGRLDLTAERFVEDPFLESPAVGERMYRSGDRVRYRRDGALEFLGRVDAQVQIRGYRVELGEIEAVLVALDGVREAAVVVHCPDGGVVKELVAYVTAAETCTGPQLRKRAAGVLPEYMVPKAVVVLDALPLTRNGKIDTKDLAARALPLQEAVAPSRELETPTQRRVAKLYRSLLAQGSDKLILGADSDFFELGGHSLLAVKLLEGVEAQFGVHLGLGALFSHPTIGEVAGAIDGESATGGMRFLQVLREGSEERAPLIFFGSVKYARTVAAALPVDRDVYALNIFGLVEDNTELKAFGLPELATQFIADIKAVQPHGPYSMASYCADSKLSYEVAQQLVAQGDEVAFVGLIDGGWVLDSHIHMSRRQLRVRRFLRNAAVFGRGYLVRKVEEQASKTGRWFRLRAEREHGNAEAESAVLIQHAALLKLYYAAQDAYVAAPFAGKLVVLSSGEWALPNAVRKRLPPQSSVEIVHIPGYHLDMFKGPQLAELMSRLEGLMAHVDAQLTSRSTTAVAG